jgi:hypothetical protein
MEDKFVLETAEGALFCLLHSTLSMIIKAVTVIRSVDDYLFENRVLRRIFAPKREEVAGGLENAA